MLWIISLWSFKKPAFLKTKSTLNICFYKFMKCSDAVVRWESCRGQFFGYFCPKVHQRRQIINLLSKGVSGSFQLSLDIEVTENAHFKIRQQLTRARTRSGFSQSRTSPHCGNPVQNLWGSGRTFYWSELETGDEFLDFVNCSF